MEAFITLLHISDIHTRIDRQRELKIRFDALARDLGRLSQKPQAILVTGDIAYAGTSAEYQQATILLSAFCKRFGIDHSQVVFCPGNHDIDRSLIDLMTEQGLKRSLLDTEAAEDAFDHPKWTLPQQQAYIDFVNAFTNGTETVPARTRMLQLSGCQIGIASLNSAWRCADDDCKERLFLTLPQVHKLAEPIDAAQLRIALVHHPLDWYHVTERDIVQKDLTRRYDLILTGHLHVPVTEATKTPIGESLVFTVPSFFDGQIAGITDGYNLYSIDLGHRCVNTLHRKFIRGREDYDRYVEHAPNGESRFDLPHTALARLPSMHLVHRITETRNALEASISQSLQLAQRVSTPILVTPLVEIVTRHARGKRYQKVSDPYALASDNPVVVYGPADVGTTIFLKGVCARIITANKSRYALYFDHADLAGTKRPDQLLKIIQNSVEAEIESLDKIQLSIAVDHIPYQDSEFIGAFLNLAAEKGWHTIICVKQDILFDALGAALSEKGIVFLRVKHWGPSRLRDFTNRYLQVMGKTVDLDAAFHFLKNCLAAADIPTTPLLVAMYLRTFCELGAQLTGLSFVRLLEKMEESNLDQTTAESAYSLYNLRLFLRRLAIECFRSRQAVISTEAFKTIISEYFAKKYLTVDPEAFVSHLVKSGFTVRDGENFGFSSFVFYNFYIAQAIEQNDIKLSEELEHIDRALRLGDALSLYAGRKRDDDTLFAGLLKCIDAAHPVGAIVDVADLERHIKHLLEPRHTNAEKDDITTKAIESRIDYDAADDDFEQSQADHRAVSRDLLAYKPPSTHIERTVRLVMTLRFLYNVMRNMEHMDGEAKMAALDRILEHHMQCNMALIDLFANVLPDEQFHSFSAYMVTLGGEAFLAHNVGAASLEKAIHELLGKTTNVFKRFLLVSLYADLRLPDYASLFESFVSEVDQVCMVEMCYAKIHELLVLYEGEKIPASLVTAFSVAFDRRQLLYDKVTPVSLQQMRDAALHEAKRQHYRVKQIKSME